VEVSSTKDVLFLEDPRSGAHREKGGAGETQTKKGRIRGKVQTGRVVEPSQIVDVDWTNSRCPGSKWGSTSCRNLWKKKKVSRTEGGGKKRGEVPFKGV